MAFLSRAAIVALAVTALAIAGAGRSAFGAQDSQTLTQLAGSVNSPDEKVRRAALKALASRGPEALEPLSLLVGDPERDIRRDAIEAILAIYVEPPPRQRISSAEDAFAWTRYRTTPWPVSNALVTNLVRGLADEWPSVRRDAAYALGIVLTPPIDTRVAEELIYSLADPDASVRLAAARSLGRLRASTAGDQLIGRITDPNLPVRLAAIQAVGEIGEARALTALRDQLEYYRGGVAGRMALEALARIAHKSTADLFAEEKFSGSDTHRRYAYEGIARMGGIAAADAVAMEQLLTSERDEEVSAAMAFALAAGGRPYLDRLILALTDNDTASQVMDYIVELGAINTPAVLAYLRHTDPIVRERVTIAMGFVDGVNEAALMPLTTDADPAVRRAAETSLIRMRVIRQAGRTR